MKIWKLTFSLATCAMLAVSAAAQYVSLQGLRTSPTHGNTPAAALAPDGSLFLFLGEQDGVRILKTDPTGTTVLAETQLGTKGDSAIAMALDPNGGIYIAGTATSGTIRATPGAAFASVVDDSTNSFLARFDNNLNLVFLTFLDSGRTAVTGVAATADAVFVTGVTFNTAFPVTANAAQQSFAADSNENGFVERFNPDGSTLIYATYLNGANGSTIPSAIVADSSDYAYIAGSTSSSSYPTAAALQPSMLLANGTTSSGFLTRLDSTGNAFVFSTFIAGSGITGLALDTATASLVLTGDVALGQFPVATVATPLTSTSYQTFLRIPIDGQSVTSSVVLAPGTQSFVTVDPNGGAWISGAITTPLFPVNILPVESTGDSFLLHLTAADNIDGTLRFGISPGNNGGNAALTSKQNAGVSNAVCKLAETVSESVSGGSGGGHVLPSGASCHIPTGITIASASGEDKPFQSGRTIGSREVPLTGFAQKVEIHLSAEEIDFGTQFSNGSIHLPRYLYLSNNSGKPIPHAQASFPADSPFGVIDSCPSMLESHSVCRMTLSYLSYITPSSDATTLHLDAGMSVLVTGATMPQASPTGNTTNPTLSVSASTLTFPTPVVVTQLATTLQILTIANTGVSSFALSFAVAGDFNLVNGCPSVLGAGGSCLLQVGFAPSQPGQREGVLTVTAGGGFTPVYVSLAGTGSAILPANNETLDIGQTLLGEPVVAWYKVQQPIMSLTVASNSSLFGLALTPDAGSGHGSLAASSFSQSVTSNCNNCWLGVQFFPNVAGSLSASLVVTSTPGGNPYQLTLAGTALPVVGLLMTPMAQDFGAIAVHSSSQAITLTLTNALASGSEANVQSVTATGDFVIATNNSGGPSCTGTLGPTASCFVQLVFAPTMTGNRSGTLTIETSGGTVTAALAGYGSADPGVAINPTAVDFSNVPDSVATQQTITLSNSGTSTLTIGPPSVSDASFSVSSSCAALPPGVACNLTVGFTPQSATVAAKLSIPVTSAATSVTYTVALSGGYTSVDAGLQVVANDVNYGSTATGAQGAARQFTINNLTNTALSVSLSLPRQFPLEFAAPCPLLAAGGSCNFSMSFLPVTGGALTGTVLVQGTPINGSAGVQALAYMEGYGAPAGSLAITGNTIPNSSLNFGQVVSGQSVQQVLTLTNNGTGSMTIRRITSEPPFLSTSNCGSKLAPDASCSITLTYAPIDEILSTSMAAPRSDESMLIVESDAISSPDILPLGGTVTPVVSSDPASSAILSYFVLTQSALTFANTQVGNESAAQTVLITNAGTTTIHILSAAVPTDFVATNTCSTLLPGAACSFSIEFAPTAAPTSTVRSGAMEILSDAGTSLEFITLLGTSAPASLTLAPASLNFGTVNIGQHAELNVTVTNSGITPVAFLGLTGSGDYSVVAGSCPATGSALAAGDACVLTVTFTPSATGTRNGTLSLANGATQLPLTVALTGMAVEAKLQVTPGSLVFSGIDSGFSGALTLTLLNTGSASVTGIANAISGTNVADFAVTAPCSTTTLAPNQGCTETVTFTPSTLGARAATLTVASSDPNGPAMIPLSGTGLKAGSFTLTVDGAASATATVAIGSPATYTLLLTPANGFTGPVALTCSPITAGQYTSCSLLASTLTLGPSALSSTATINTITSEGGEITVGLSGLFLLPFMVFKRRRDKSKAAAWLMLMAWSAGFATLSGCGGHSSAGSNLRTTPAGTYEYQVTASSISGAVVSSTVTLTLVVQ